MKKGIKISRPKVSRLRRKIGPPNHRPYGPESGLTDGQYEWWATQKGRPLLMRNMIAVLMSLTPEQLERFRLGIVTLEIG